MKATSILTIFAAGIIALGSCKKDSNSNGGGNNNNNTYGTWKVGNTSYAAASVSGNTLFGTFNLTAQTAGSNQQANTLTFVFNSLDRPAAGQYKINNDGGNNTDAVYVFATTYENGSPVLYGCQGHDNTKATVSINNGKISISVPETWAGKSASGLNITDSVKLSATAITEQ